MNTLPLPQCVEVSAHWVASCGLCSPLPVALLDWFWSATDLPDLPGHMHTRELKSSWRRSMILCIRIKCDAPSKLSRRDSFISTEKVKNIEQGHVYLTPVLSHVLFPAQVSGEAKKLYTQRCKTTPNVTAGWAWDAFIRASVSKISSCILCFYDFRKLFLKWNTKMMKILATNHH